MFSKEVNNEDLAPNFKLATICLLNYTNLMKNKDISLTIKNKKILFSKYHLTEEMDKKIKKILKIICQKEEVVFVYLYGSFIEKENFKDIDIALYLDEKKINEIDIIDYEIDLSLQIEKELKIPVDIKIINSAPLSFRYSVSCGLLLFSRDESKREEFLCNTWKEYFDFLPIAKIYLKEVLSA